MFNLTWQQPKFGKAIFRQLPEDFKVQEELGHDLDGEGEFLFVYIEKRLQNTHWVADQLARLAGIASKAVTYSGRKDRYAITQQWFCLHIINKETPEDWLDKEIIKGCLCLKLSRHRRKLHLGQHKKNRFEITLKEINESKQHEIEQALALLKQQGAPNYFGEQRFGYQGANMETVAYWMQEAKRPRGRTRQSMAISALRSFFFNEMLKERQQHCRLNQAIEGECFVLNGGNSVFVWADRGEDYIERLESGVIHPSLVMLGEGESLASAKALEFENTIFSGVIEENLSLSASMAFFEQYKIKIARRAARVNVDNFTWQWHNGRQLTCRFELVTGSFATAVLGELFELEDASKLEVDN